MADEYRELTSEEKTRLERARDREQVLINYYLYMKDKVLKRLEGLDEEYKWSLYEHKTQLKQNIGEANRNLEEAKFTLKTVSEQLEKGMKVIEQKEEDDNGKN